MYHKIETISPQDFENFCRKLRALCNVSAISLPRAQLNLNIHEHAYHRFFRRATLLVELTGNHREQEKEKGCYVTALARTPRGRQARRL